MANKTKLVTRKGLALLGVVVACAGLAVYVALAPTKKTLAPGSALENMARRSGVAEAPHAPSQGPIASADLPSREVVVEITRRAVRDVVQVHDGFMPSVLAVTDCYQHLVVDDMERRIFCVQLDAAAWTIEKMAPPAWRAKDESVNDYFNDLRFRQRQLHYAIPLSDAPEFVVHKRKFLSVLGYALSLAMRNELDKKAATEPPAAPDQIL